MTSPLPIRRRPGPSLVGMAIGLAAIFAPGWLAAFAPAAAQPRLFYNASASIPRGFYALVTQPPRVGDIILTRLPAAAARLAAERRYLPLNVPLIKPIAR